MVSTSVFIPTWNRVIFVVFFFLQRKTGEFLVITSAIKFVLLYKTHIYMNHSVSWLLFRFACIFFYRYLALLHQHTDFQSNILSHQFAQWRALPIRIMSMHFSFFFHCCYKYQPLTRFRMSIISDQARFIDCKMKRVHFQCSIYCLCVCLWIISVFILSQIARSNL